MTNLIDLEDGKRKVAHQVFGSGPPVVFVHGWLLHGETFRDVVSIMAKDFTCHVIDLPGAGDSVWSADAPINLAAQTEALAEAINALELDRFAMVAHDSGGVFARYVAAQMPDRVCGLVMSDTDIPKQRPFLIKLFRTTLKSPGGFRTMEFLLRRRLVRSSPLFARALFQKAGYAKGEFFDLFIAPLFADRRKLRGQLQLMANWDYGFVDGLASVHSKIVAPTQLLWGTSDSVFPLKKARRMVEQFGGPVELHTIDGAKLFWHEERPAELANYATEFLNRCFDQEPQRTL